MTPELDPGALALEMKVAQDSAQQLEPFTARYSGFDLAAAYEVADVVHRARMAAGARSVGRKIGFTNHEMWSVYGVREPIWGYLYDKTVVQLDDTRATCSLGRFVEPKIEPEIVFGFRTAPRPGASIPGILESIDWVANGFEVVQSHFPGWRFQAADTVADGGLHGNLLIGPRQSVSQLGSDAMAALESFTLTLSCDGQPVTTGKGSNVLGSPLAAIAHLLEVLARQPDYAPLQAGDIVTTGTITTAETIQPGETWQSEVQGIALPDLAVEFFDGKG
ncbi:MAG: fumarylacetoacetate hydrolase family protein [Natronospirillum sp.]|uniref:2-keto-4-pentenoate hydratase n=1 Tax=Natronospirillum sp. TaxID=2812955 RepID=UPI0025ED5491|nr:fumarylacetoacetate hydrolase family protein [Natronospirillum sp.]MCH8550883.1 fumarylacetoacetate hydrolase family protein [Natronospirillum sp.]